MLMACLDLEGVLVPEIWIGFSEKTGIEELRLTTRDVPDYDALMRRRLGILEEHGLGLPDIHQVIGSLSPLPGAAEFLAGLREDFQVVILSDTFYEFAAPLMRQLGQPFLLCNRLLVDEAGRITDFRIRQADPKRCAVRAFHVDARRGGRRHPLPPSRQRDRRVSPVPGDAGLRGPAQRVRRRP